jgi:hypothetical protein
MKRFRLFPHSIFIIGLLLALSACGIRFTYNRLDWIIPWYLDDYIELSDEQNSLFERQLATHLRWHRNTQLPEYSQQLRQVSAELQDGLTLAELDAMTERFRTIWQTLVTQLTPDIANLLATASDAQIRELFDNIELRNEKYRRKYVDLPEDELREKRAERVSERIEDWLGQITPAQQKAVNEWSRRFEATADLTLEYRKEWQARARTLLQRRREPDYFRTALQELLLHPEQSQSAPLQQAREHNLALFLDLILQIDKLMSSGQRRYLSNKIMTMAKDFEQLTQTE